jgi:neurofibromin 1
MDELVSWPKDQHCFELDPSNISYDYYGKNKDNVIRATSLILDAICSSTFMAPACFRAVCNIILESVKNRFPESKYTAVGSFIFLRFFCPVIVSPESAGLVKPGLIDKESRRGLLIIAKVVQNIANNVLFGSKEVYMVVLNDFVTENMYLVTSYLRNMTFVDGHDGNSSSSNSSSSDKANDKSSVPDTGISPQMNDTDYRLLHSVLAKSFEKIQHDLATKKLLMFDNQESLTSWNDFMEEFSMVLVHLGPPPENIKNLANFGLQQRYISKVKDSRQYTEFMRSFGNCSTNAIAQKNICYAGGSSMAGHCVMYFIFRRLRVEEVDMELLLYYIFQVPTILNSDIRLSDSLLSFFTR